MGLKESIVAFFVGPFWAYVLDFVVICNVIYVGVEVDNEDAVADLAKVLPTVFCIIYVLELVVVVGTDPVGYLKRKHLAKAEAVVVLVAIYGVWVNSSNKLFWRFSAVRAIRGARILKKALMSDRLAELWLVLAGVWNCMSALVTLIFVLLVIVLVFGVLVRGLVHGESDDDDLTTAVCGGDDFRVHLNCIDVDQYFGNVLKSAFTLFQAMTLDRWAAHIARPLWDIRPLAALFILGFVVIATYGMMSIAVGVFVHSTVELARNHDSHRDRVSIVQDRELLHNLRDYFYKSLQLIDRDMLDFRELKEALQVPQVKQAYDQLDFPVASLNQLWSHLDPYDYGEITLDEFEDGCKRLLEPAKKFDMACLSARLAGRARFSERLAERCDRTCEDIDVLCRNLSGGFAKLRDHVLSNEVNDLFPEVGLRRAGKMVIPHDEEEDGPKFKFSA